MPTWGSHHPRADNIMQQLPGNSFDACLDWVQTTARSRGWADFWRVCGTRARAHVSMGMLGGDGRGCWVWPAVPVSSSSRNCDSRTPPCSPCAHRQSCMPASRHRCACGQGFGRECRFVCPCPSHPSSLPPDLPPPPWNTLTAIHDGRGSSSQVLGLLVGGTRPIVVLVDGGQQVTAAAAALCAAVIRPAA